MDDVVKVVKKGKVKEELKKVLKDSLTNSVGDYDPARVAGYLVVILGGLAFIGLSIYDTIVNKKFNYEGYAIGLSGVAVTIAGAAAGVWIKKGAEPVTKATTVEQTS